MNGERLRWVLVVLVLLVAGWLIGRFSSVPPEAEPVESSEFRSWFWQARGLDIAVQVGLIMVGALSVAALLPMGEEDDS